MAIIESKTFPLSLQVGRDRTCLGPDGRLDPPQPVYQRSGHYRFPDETTLLASGQHPIKEREIIIVACPQLGEGNICKRQNISCIKPFVISSPPFLAAQPDNTTLTFRSASTLELFNRKP